jgi:hypothetical protein
MSLPTAETPLYNHPLPEIEKWLQDLGCQQNREQLHCWTVEKATWQAEICLEIEELTVNYFQKESGEKDIQRSFKYSLSRRDIESAVFSGP